MHTRGVSCFWDSSAVNVRPAQRHADAVEVIWRHARGDTIGALFRTVGSVLTGGAPAGTTLEVFVKFP